MRSRLRKMENAPAAHRRSGTYQADTVGHLRLDATRLRAEQLLRAWKHAAAIYQCFPATFRSLSHRCNRDRSHIRIYAGLFMPYFWSTMLRCYPPRTAVW